MANVLIGIIGVILFIGLALAAVLFLGPQFQQATANSKGSAAIQATAQVAQAANLYYEQTGAAVGVASDAGGSTSALYTGNYLKSDPVNPVVAGSAVQLVSSVGSNSTGTAVVALMPIGSNDNICTQIGIQTGQLASSATAPATAPATLSGTTLTTVSGCIKDPTTGGPTGLTAGTDYVYTVI